MVEDYYAGAELCVRKTRQNVSPKYFSTSMGKGDDWAVVVPREVEGILAAVKGAKGQKHIDTTPALLYAKLTTRLFLKVNLHSPAGPSKRRGSVPIPSRAISPN